MEEAWNYKKTEQWIEQQIEAAKNKADRIHTRHQAGALEALYASHANVVISPWGHWRVLLEVQNGELHNYGLSHMATGMLASLLQGPGLLALELYGGDDFSGKCEAHIPIKTEDVKWMVEG